MIRLGLMLERSRADESTFAGPYVCPKEARRVLRVRGEAVWYLGVPFAPRRASVDSVNVSHLHPIYGNIVTRIAHGLDGLLRGPQARTAPSSGLPSPPTPGRMAR